MSTVLYRRCQNGYNGDHNGAGLGEGGQTFPLSTSSPMIKQAAVRMGFAKGSGMAVVVEAAILEIWREIWARRGNMARGCKYLVWELGANLMANDFINNFTIRHHFSLPLPTLTLTLLFPQNTCVYNHVHKLTDSSAQPR